MLLFFLWLPGIDSTYHHSLSPPPSPCLMLIFLGGRKQLQDGDEVKCLRFISQRSLIQKKQPKHKGFGELLDSLERETHEERV
ncbi:hypothetical protein AMTRI_Chr03g47060 [Amborella trichopoda]